MESGSVVASEENSGETLWVVFAPRPAKEKSVAIAVVAAVILHLMAFGAMVGGAVINILAEQKDIEVVSKAPADNGRDSLVELDALELMAMRDALEQAGAPPEISDRLTDDISLPEPAEVNSKRFAETSPEQEIESTPEGAVLIGERNTEESSELAPSRTDGLALPTQNGRESERSERILTDSTFSPGENEGQADPGEPRKEVTGSVIREPESPVPPNDEVEPPRGRDVVEVPAGEESDLRQQKNENYPDRPENVDVDESVEEGLKETSEDRLKKASERAGFNTEARKTRMEGTISRRGQSSLKVEATALGKYKAQVNRIIETEWQRRCVMHRDHVLPGILTLRFYVDKAGQVSGLRYLDVFQASAMQKGFTMRAVQQPQLPRMPEEVINELDGEDLEFHINFHF
ncbi:MAG: hypothetical protein CMN06_12635 [Roseibacillus sp.]|nr:hypothetical protein [Roseibacillus sp.]